MGKIRQENFGLKLGQILESYKLEKIGQKGKNKIDKNWAKWETQAKLGKNGKLKSTKMGEKNWTKWAKIGKIREKW